MKKKFVWLVGSTLMVLVLLAAACAPAPEEKAPAAPKEVAPAVKEAAPAVKEAAPAVKEAAPVIKEAAPIASAVEKDMVTVTLTKLDGTSVVKTFEKPRYGGVINLLGSANVVSWDETQEAPWCVANTLGWTNEELLVGDWTRGPAGTGEVSWTLRGWFNLNYQIGQLAESWEFPDDETIVFHMRKGVRWQNRPPVNGRELVANDVVYSLRRIYIDTPTSSMYGMAGEGRPVDVYAPDKYTVVVKTRPGFIITTLDYVAGWTRIYAPEVEKAYGNQNVDIRSVGTGPFLITEWVPESSFKYVRNPNYWDTDHMLGKDYPLPYLDGVKCLVIPDLSTQSAAMRTGKIDAQGTAGGGIAWREADTLIKTVPRLGYSKYSVCGRYWIGGRLDKGLPFDDIRVRRALQMGIDKQEYAELLYGGTADILSCPVTHLKEWVRAYTPLEKLPLSSDGFDNKKLYGYYPEEAKKLLAEAGYPNGFKTSVIYTGSSMGYGVCTDDVFQILKAQWAKIGVELVLEPKTAAVRNSLYQRKTYDECLQQSMASNFPQHMYTVRAGNIYNTAMVNDPKMEELYRQISVLTPFSDPWWAKLSEVNLYHIDRVYYATIPSGYEWAFWQPWLNRYYGEHDIGPYKYCQAWLEHAWIDQELKQSLGY